MNTTARAAALICAAHDRDHIAISNTLADLTPPELRELAVLLAGHINPDQPLTPLPTTTNIQACIRGASTRFGVPAAAICSPSRRAEHIAARHATAYAARLCGATLTAIGEALGRDHTTVMNSITRVGENPALRAAAHSIAEQVGNTTFEGDEGLLPPVGKGC